MIANETAARAFVKERCDPLALERLNAFVAMLEQENASQNLIAASTLGTVWQRHIADSAQLLDLEPDVSGRWLDLGTGAGFPGLVIAIMRPTIVVTLVESRKRRIEWLERVVQMLDLAACAVIGNRLESVPSFAATTISARAFAPIVRLIASARRFSTKDTVWLLPKGRSAVQELEALPARERKMFHVKQSLTDPEAGILFGKGVEGEKK